MQTTIQLNGLQRQAAENTADNLLLLAGAGTGKTGTLACRVARLIQEGIAASGEILCLTFTNRACREMSERIEAQAGLSAQDVTIRTVHGFCAWLLRHTPAARTDIGFDFSICDEEDAMETVRAAVQEVLGRPIEAHPARVLLRFIELLKEHQLTNPALGCREAAMHLFQTEMERVKKLCVDPQYNFDPKFYAFLGKYGASITELYSRRLLANHTLDFNDLLLRAARLLEDPEQADYWGGRYRFVHVDEVQDVSLAEYRLITRLCRHARVLLCGDFNQTIYAWRGSQPKELIAAYTEDFSPVTIALVENYRATPQLLDSAQNFLCHAFGLGTASSFDPRGADSTDLAFREFAAPEQEMAWIHQQIEALHPDDLSRIGILTRNNNACRTACQLLSMRRLDGEAIPFMLADELRLFRRTEIKDVLAFLRLYLNPLDSESLRRILIRFAQGITPGVLSTVLKESKFAGTALPDFAAHATFASGDYFDPLLSALDSGRAVVFDVESTGTDVYTDEIIQMAAVRLAPDGSVSARFEVFLQSSLPVGDSEQVHGFSDAYLQENGLPPHEALARFLEFVSGCVIVGHNVGFDMAITAQNLKRAGIETPFTNLWYDTLDLARRYLPSLENHKLATVAAAVNAAHEPSHDAMDDILATADVLNALTARCIRPLTEERRKLYKKYIPRFADIHTILHAFRRQPPESAPAFLESIYSQYSLLDSTVDPSIRANLLILQDFVSEQADLSLPLEAQLSGVLELTALSSGDLDRLGKSCGKVPVITVHQAKGCEFDYVFMPMLEEGVFPSYQSILSEKDEEERRVFYVSITRAKKKLFLSWSRKNERGRPVKPSRYLSMLRPAQDKAPVQEGMP